MSFISKIGDNVTSAVVTGLSADAQLRTPCGERRVENIRPGDLIVTRGGGLQPVRMVWTRTLTLAERQEDPSCVPVCLGPRVVGPMMPQRSLTLAPDHRILVPAHLLSDVGGQGGLMMARDLVGLSDKAHLDRTTDDITLYNIVFDGPQVVMASGLPVETFHVSPDHLAAVPETGRSEIMRLFPAARGKGAPVAPLPYPAVEADDYAPAFA
ncbi:Hint domain-containing protein [Aestuariibius insulae]|uniref:Hint domain-containing protein n=1 Tax=Aestuariibius insulae TaxID=2058287 RepID=UPI00345E8D47